MKQENKEKILKYPTTNIIIYYKKMKQIQKKYMKKTNITITRISRRKKNE